MGIDGVISIPMLQDDGETVGAELAHQSDLPRLYRLDRRPDRRGDADPVPPNDSPAGEGVPPKAVHDCAFDGPIELAQVSGGDRARRGRRAAQGPPGELVSPR